MENVYLIVGLGNPGQEYERTRHNAGWMVGERLASRWEAVWSIDKRLQARVAVRPAFGPAQDRSGQEARRCLLGLPLTFMNVSGQAVAALTRFYQVALERLLVIVDDADLDLGTLRLKPSGSSGGHHGLESIEQHLGSRQFARLRVGIGRDDRSGREISGHVLSAFARSEGPLLGQVLDRACDQAECWVESGPQLAMNKFNGTIEPKARE